MTDYMVKQIDETLTYHINYGKHQSDRYIKKMDKLAMFESGTLSQKVSSLLNKYYKKVDVENLNEAITRLKIRNGDV